MTYLLMLGVLLFPLLSWAGDHTVTLTAGEEATLLVLTNKTNADRLANGVPLTRFCKDDPAVCATPDPQAYLVFTVQSILVNYEANKSRDIALKIRQYCEASPKDVDCVTLGTKVP